MFLSELDPATATDHDLMCAATVIYMDCGAEIDAHERKLIAELERRGLSVY